MKRLTEEYIKFREDILALKKEEIFERAIKIVFYNEIYRYFKSRDILPDKEMTIQELYIFYIKYEGSNINDNEGIAEFLEYYKKFKI